MVKLVLCCLSVPICWAHYVFVKWLVDGSSALHNKPVDLCMYRERGERVGGTTIANVDLCITTSDVSLTLSRCMPIRHCQGM